MYKILFIEKNTYWKNFEELEKENLFIDTVFYENISSPIKGYHLCIVEIDINDKEYLKNIKELISKNPQIIFWATNTTCSKDDIVKAYEIGFKNFIKLPLEKEIIINSINHSQENNEANCIASDMNFSECKNSKILILDDLEINIELLKEVLKPFQIEPVCYTDPSKALNILNMEAFDLILLDIMMPNLTGFEFAEKIKESECNQTTPIIFISALEGQENKLKSYNLGSYAYIEKPIDIKTTRAQIYNVLKIKQLQDSLFNEKEKLDNIFKFSNSEILLTDSKFNVLSHNNRYTISPQENPFNFIELVNKSNEEKLVQHIIDFGTIPQQNISLRLKYKNDITGENIPVNACISKRFTEQNTLDGYLILVNDISQEIKSQAEKETFIATLTHDLKTPIRAQVRALELILDSKFGDVNDNIKGILSEVLNSCKFMQYMTDNLLTKYKSESGQLNIVKEKKSIYEIIKNNSENLRYLLAQKNQKINILYNTDIQELEFDPYEIERVLNNLIINASEYTPDSGEITIKIEEVDNYLKISVIDNGWGIPKDDVDKIFDEFMSSSKKFRKVGYGLGLYICKKIIESHDGKIYVKSEEGKGSEFVFTLPIDKKIANSKN